MAIASKFAQASKNHSTKGYFDGLPALKGGLQELFRKDKYWGGLIATGLAGDVLMVKAAFPEWVEDADKRDIIAKAEQAALKCIESAYKAWPSKDKVKASEIPWPTRTVGGCEVLEIEGEEKAIWPSTAFKSAFIREVSALWASKNESEAQDVEDSVILGIERKEWRDRTANELFAH